MLHVTKSFLPELTSYTKYLERIWNTSHLTNDGPLLLELEAKLAEFLEVENFFFVSNGTIALQLAIKSLGLKGDIITTPFSYCATSNSIIWENCEPIFADISTESLTVESESIKSKITKDTQAILTTHVYGNAGDLEGQVNLAQEFGIPLIFDGAHAFGVKYKGRSIFNYGDISTCSFHATKLFHTGEGGAIFCKDTELREKLYYSHNFGHNGPLDFHGVGINGKITELQAAMGLSVLPYMTEIIEGRKKVIEFYDAHLDFTKISKIKIRENTNWNNSYYPVLFHTEAALLEAQNRLNAAQIFPRRYFYPSLNTINYVKSTSMPVSESVASRILCLPLAYDLIFNEIQLIVNTTNNE